MAKRTISEAIDSYLTILNHNRSDNTVSSYANGLAKFRQALDENKVDPDTALLDELSEQSIGWLGALLNEESKADTSKRLYFSAAVGFFTWLIDEDMMEVNLPRLRKLVEMHTQRQGLKVPQFPQQKIEQLLDYVLKLPEQGTNTDRCRLLNLRDAALIVCLADTGLRVHEACKLTRGDIVWEEGKAVITGKGNKQAVVRFSGRSLELMRGYVNERQMIECSYGKPLVSVPIFSGHSRNQASKRTDEKTGLDKGLVPLTTRNAQRIIQRRVAEALEPEDIGTITPHSFRHYFVTTVLLASGGDMRLAQELARHSNIAMTQRYTHLTDERLDKGYHEIFNRG